MYTIPIEVLYSWWIFFFICRLFLMLQRFPVESKGRRKKLQEVLPLHAYFCMQNCFGFFLCPLLIMLGVYLCLLGWLCNYYMLLLFSCEMCNGKHGVRRLVFPLICTVLIVVIYWSITLSFCYRCSSMHLIKLQTLTYWTILFSTSCTTWYILLLICM